MRVLILTHKSLVYTRTGITKIIFYIARKLEADVVCMDEPEEKPIDIQGVNYYHGKEWFIKLANKYDILLTHDPYTFIGSDFCKWNNIKHVALVDAYYEGLDAYNPASYEADLYIFTTEWIRDKWTNKSGTRENIILHPPTFPAEHITKKGNKVTLINLTQQKGGVMFSNLAKLMPSVQFLAVKGGHSKQRDDLLRGLRNVEIMEPVEDMKIVWSKTKILLQPSTFEMWSMVVREAMYSGIPTIASNTPGLVENIGNGGVIMDNFNLTKWKFWINKLLRDDSCYNELSRKALQRSTEISSEKELKALFFKLNEL